VLIQGLYLTIIGMAVVFVFLTILVIIMYLVSAFVLRFFPEKEVKVVKKVAGDDVDIAVAIAAVKSFQKS